MEVKNQDMDSKIKVVMLIYCVIAASVVASVLLVMQPIAKADANNS